MRTIVLFAALLAGCATDRVVSVPVSVPCLGAAPETPEYRYGVGAYPGDAIAAKWLAADLIDAKQYVVELKAQMRGCK